MMQSFARNVETKFQAVHEMCGSRLARRVHRHHEETVQQNHIQKATSHIFRSSEVMCIECGKMNPEGSKFCIACGSAIRICPISMQPFHPGDNYARCIHCDSYFHLDHLKDWMNGNCPICKNPLEVVLGKFEHIAPPSSKNRASKMAMD